jgi:hypothetical protein
MMLLIGSQALVIRDASFLGGRSPADVDAIATMDEVNVFTSARRSKFQSIMPAFKGTKVIARGAEVLPHEFEIAWSDSTGRTLLDMVRTDPDTVTHTIDGQRYLVPSLGVLLALKESHKYLKNSAHFRKTRLDILKMRAAGLTIPERYKEWYKAREKATYDYGHPNLNQGKMGFFSGDGVHYVYDHDSIHEAVMIHEAPAYTFFKKDNEEVAVDKEKFFKLPFEKQIASVLEESYVLALERSQIPFKGSVTPEKSFNMALEKVCTSITSGWWRKFAWENFDIALERYDPLYADKFWAAVASGNVKPFVGQTMEAA